MYFNELIKDVIRPVLNYRENKDFYYWKSKYRKPLLAYKNIHEGEDCFIMGNGPSIRNMELERLNDYHTFALNKAYLLFDFFDLDFSYHVCVDDVVLGQIQDMIEEGKLKCPSFISHLDLKRPMKDLPHILRLYTNGAISFYKDISLPLCQGSTVAYLAMEIAYYMGFKRVFLIGIDHNWPIAGESNSISKLESEDVNHFHPDYFKGMNWHAPDKEGNEAFFALAKYHYHRDNKQILDATVNGKLTVFPKISFEEALQIAKKK